MFESWSGYHLFKNLRLEIAGRILFAPVRLRVGAFVAALNSIMSAFPESGRSPGSQIPSINGRFRPEADVEALCLMYSKFQPLHHPFTGLRQGLPVIRSRIIEANQLQYLVVFRGEYCV